MMYHLILDVVIYQTNHPWSWYVMDRQRSMFAISVWHVKFMEIDQR
jgi:hypothetical protein